MRGLDWHAAFMASLGFLQAGMHEVVVRDHALCGCIWIVSQCVAACSPYCPAAGQMSAAFNC